MKPRLSTAIASALIVATLVYPIAAWLLGRTVPGYSHLEQQISELGVSGLPYAWVLTVVLLIDATLVLAISRALRNVGGDRHRWSLRLLVLYAIVLALGGLFPCDEHCRPTTMAGLVHVLNVLPSLVAVVGAPLLMSRRLADDPRLTLVASMCFTIAVVTGAAVIAALGVFPALGLAGLGQRIVLACQLSFFALLGFAVIHTQRAPAVGSAT